MLLLNYTLCIVLCVKFIGRSGGGAYGYVRALTIISHQLYMSSDFYLLLAAFCIARTWSTLICSEITTMSRHILYKNIMYIVFTCLTIPI